MKVDPAREKKRQEVIESVRNAVPDILREFPGLTKIWIVGSVATPLFFDMRSDVDVVVDGLPSGQYFDLYRLLEKRFDVKIDLIDLNDVPEKDRRRFERRIAIYEKTPV